MAHVWRAVDTSLSRPVAVKVMKLGLDQMERERFLAEARALSRLRSRHLLEVLDFGEQDGSFYFVMPFVQVACLADVMTLRRREDRRFDAATAAALGLQIARALAEAHRHNILHRDVKPQNILVSPAGAAYLTDFGIARDLSRDTSLTEAGTVLGTPRYMPPEQLQGKPLDFSTDLYSLGLLLFELAAGRLPGEVSSDLPATLRYRLSGKSENLTDLTPDATGLAPVVARALATRESGRRYSTADELAEALAPLAARAEVLATLGGDVLALLGSQVLERSALGATSPWTVMGQQASFASLAGAEPALAARPAAPEVPLRGPAVPPLARGPGASGQAPQPLPLAPASVSRPMGSRSPSRLLMAPLKRHRVAAAAGTALLAGLLFAWSWRARPSVQAPVVTDIRPVTGFRKLRLEWSGDAKELSLVTPKGHESLYDVRGRTEWESASLAEAGTYIASLVPASGEAVQVPPIEYAPLDPGTLPVRLARDLEGARLELVLPVEAEVEATVRGEGLSAARAASAGAARRHTLRIRFDPMEGASLQLTFRSRLGERAVGRPVELASMTTAFRNAAAASMELMSKVQWKPWCDRLLRRHFTGDHLAPAVLKDLATLAVDAPFADLYPAVAGFFESSRVALDEKHELYRALMRLQDVDFFCERHGLPTHGPAARAMPASWICTTVPVLLGAEELQLPFSGIMSFKPKLPPKVVAYDFLDEITKVSSKETVVELTDVASVAKAELALETWALKPDQWFSVSVNGRLELEFRPRGKDSRERIAKKETLSLYHPLDPSSLVEGRNRFRVSIFAFPPGVTADSAALNAASLWIARRARPGSSAREPKTGAAGRPSGVP